MSFIDRLRRHEGFRPQVYDDATGKPIQKGSHVIGNPTIGVGVLLSYPGGITSSESEMLLRNRVQIAQTAATNLLGLPFVAADPVRFDVFVEMAYQMGGDGLAKFVNTLKAAREHRWEDAAHGMLDSLWARQTPKRARELSEVMRTGKA